MVLQAFFLHLISMRNVYGAHTLWTLMGIAGRLAEGMGLHCDGIYLGLPPFDTEIRRRLWWQIKMLDSKFAELAGHARIKNVTEDSQMTYMPSNVNDNQIYPGMSLFPVETEGFTDMCFCCLMSEFIRFWTRHAARRRAEHGEDATLWDNYGSKSDIAEMDRAVDELKQVLDKNYVRNCDPTRPVQLITLIMARTAPNHMHFIAHHPRRWGRDEDIPDSERQYVWDLAIKQLETEVMIKSNRQFDRFAWYISSFFPWAQAIYILDCLRSNPLLSCAAKAWQLIGQLYHHCPDLISKKKLICVALGNLCLKAHNARIAALEQQGKSVVRIPNYITALRSLREGGNFQSESQERRHYRLNDDLHLRVTTSTCMPSSDDSRQTDSLSTPSTSRTFIEKKKDTRMRSVDQSKFPIVAINGQPQANNCEYVASPDDVHDESCALSAYADDSIALENNIPPETENCINDVGLEFIDWEQWDVLLQDWNGSFPGS
jgi:hypothetical protein